MVAGNPNKEEDSARDQADLSRFSAEAAYADSIFQQALNNNDASIVALERSLRYDPGYAPAILSMGSVEYQRDNEVRGKKLFMSLLSLPGDAVDGGDADLAQIIDEAGTFLIQMGRYDDGLELYRAAVARFPRTSVLHQGIGCCAGHVGRHEEAISASRAAVSLEPDNQEFVNDLGWSLYEAGRLEEAQAVLNRAVSMDPSDDLARENLRLCNRKISDGQVGNEGV